MVTKIYENGTEIAKVSDKLSTSEISKLFPGKTIALERNISAAKPSMGRSMFSKKLKPMDNSKQSVDKKNNKKVSVRKKIIKGGKAAITFGKKIVKSKGFKGLLNAANKQSDKLSKTGSIKRVMYAPLKKKKLY